MHATNYCLQCLYNVCDSSICDVIPPGIASSYSLSASMSSLQCSFTKSRVDDLLLVSSRVDKDIWSHNYVSGFEKRAHFAQRPNFFLFLIADIFQAVKATGLKPGMTVLQSLHYASYKFRTMLTSGLGVVVASVTRSRKLAVLCLTLELHPFR